MSGESDDVQTSGDDVGRSAAVLRILKDRSTIAEEAARMDVDVRTVEHWLVLTVESFGRALELQSHG